MPIDIAELESCEPPHLVAGGHLSHGGSCAQPRVGGRGGVDGGQGRRRHDHLRGESVLPRVGHRQPGGDPDIVRSSATDPTAEPAPHPRRPARAPGARAAAAHLGRGVGMGHEVEPPRGLTLGPPVHREGDQVRPVLEIAEQHGAGASGAPPGDGEPHCPPVGVVLRRPEADSAARHPVDGSVDVPDADDDPSGREPGLATGFTRHDTTSSYSAGSVSPSVLCARSTPSCAHRPALSRHDERHAAYCRAAAEPRRMGRTGLTGGPARGPCPSSGRPIRPSGSVFRGSATTRWSR